MQINSYIFHSPYSSQIQIGRLDRSVNNDKVDLSTKTQEENNVKKTNQKSQVFENIKAQENRKAIQSSNNLLNIYG